MAKYASRIRISDIAEKVGVSPGTVDRVLHGRGGVNEKTQQRVLDMVKEMGYKPNLVARALASKKEIRIAVLFPNPHLENPYWSLPLAGVESAMQELTDYYVETTIVFFDASDERDYRRACDEVLTLQPHGVVMNPVFQKPTEDLVCELDAFELPYLFFDINISGLRNVMFFGQDAYASGYAAAKLFFMQAKDKDQLLMVCLANHKKVSHHLQSRGEGFQAFFDEHRKEKDIEVIALDLDLLEEEALGNEMKQAQLNASRLKGIFVPSSRVFKVVPHITNPKLLVVGYDKIEENMKLVHEGKIDFLICQKAAEQAHRAVLSMFHILLTGQVDERPTLSPIDIIFKENIQYY